MDHELLEKARDAARFIEPADLHGTVCGMAAASPHDFEVNALVELLGTDALEDESTVRSFVTESLDRYYATDMEFYPLVPDDDEPLPARLAGLASWCSGFISGFGARMDRPIADLPDEVAEVLRDFASIGSLDEAVEEVDENEVDFMQLFEYVRVGAVLALTLMMSATDGDED